MEKKKVSMRTWSRPVRWAKTIFFLTSMVVSLLFICAPPLLVVILDLVIPPSLLSAAGGTSWSSSFSPARFLSWRSFGFRSSLIDLPLMSAARSLLILCAYVASQGHKEVYLWFTTLCSSASIGYAVIKAVGIYAAAAASSGGKRRLFGLDGRDGLVIEFLFLSSLGLAIGHIIAAYVTSCRERRKELVYKIDIEAVKMKGNLIKISVQ